MVITVKVREANTKIQNCELIMRCVPGLWELVSFARN